MFNHPLVRIAGATAVLLATAVPSSADFEPATGYRQSAVFDTMAQAVTITGLDFTGHHAIMAAGTNLWSVDLNSAAVTHAGSLPPNPASGFVRVIDGVRYASYDISTDFPWPARFGFLDPGGTFQPLGTFDGLYDAAVNRQGELFLAANPGFLGSKIFRYDPAITAAVEVINVGGWSGGIAFDTNDHLYVATQTGDGILRFHADQLAAGGLTAADGQPVVAIGASYLCFDPHNRLFAVSGYGTKLALYDPETGHELRVIAIDNRGAYGIQRIAWDNVRRQLLVIYTDYFSTFSSTLHAVTFSAANEGLHHSDPRIQGWIAAVIAHERPDPDSGGYAVDALGEFVTNATRAVAGRPASFDSAEWPLGNILSLGNNGRIVLALEDIIVNRPGPDFAVFENAFTYEGNTFAEFAFVEVASAAEGPWARFPVTFHATNLYAPFGEAYGMVDVTRVDGLAGKHVLAYGTPFDLDWLAHLPEVINGDVDLNRIVYIRLTDIVGDGTTLDDLGQPIRDAHGIFASMTDGFDLRGIAVLHHAGVQMTAADDALHAVWATYPDRYYQLQHFADGAWVDHGSPVEGTGGPVAFELPDGHPHAMFRIRQLP